MGHARGRYDAAAPERPRQRVAEHERRLPDGACVSRHGSASANCMRELAALRAAFEAKAAEFARRAEDRPHPAAGRRADDARPGVLGLRRDDRRGRSAPRRSAGAAHRGEPRRDGGRHRHQRAGRLRSAVVPLLAELSGVPVVRAPNLVEATQDTGAFIQVSGVLKRVACKLSKTCHDLRLLSSGPQAGFADILLPPRQAGSSIMPGKVNPVIPEVMNQVAFEVIGNDITITMAAEAGQLQLNAFEPIIAWSLHKSVRHLRQACLTLRLHCVEGIRANRELLARRVAESATLATALGPLIGYDKAALVSKTALASGTTIASTAHALGVMSIAETQALLVPGRLTQPAAAWARGRSTDELRAPPRRHRRRRRRRPRARHAAGQPARPRCGRHARRPPSRPRVEAEAARDRRRQHGSGSARGRLPRPGALARLPLSHRGNDRARSRNDARSMSPLRSTPRAARSRRGARSATTRL